MEEYETDFEEEQDNQEEDFLDMDMGGLNEEMEPETVVRGINESGRSPLKKVLEGISKGIFNMEGQIKALERQIKGVEKQMEKMREGLCLKQGDAESEQEHAISAWTRRRKAGKAAKQGQELLGILQRSPFDDGQMAQICAGIEEGLTIQEIRAYARKELTAKSMESIRAVYRKIKEDKK